ncbi:YdeI/OmpD-associated family protein [Flavobacteriaceae bacterium SZ-1-7]|uniref:YdeI/OmpD-associated family protein n=1 Tax=Tamlana sedimenti TaxID=3134126 RepID=UPI0031216358
MTQSVEEYLARGCGRCSLGGTPDCKVHTWINELELLRHMVLQCGLTEECKWGMPTYTFNGKNVLMISAFKNHCSISFFKGALLDDTKNILDKPGENSQAVRLIKFTDSKQIKTLEGNIKAYIYESIEIEKAGLNVEFKKNPEPIPEELEQKFDEDPTLKSTFEALTPGRQRGYILYFSAPKQAKTRANRIENCIPKILNGEGLHDKYKARKK